MNKSNNIVIFASGGGSNAQAIIDHFRNNKVGEVALIITNRKMAGVIDRAKKASIPCEIISKDQLNDEEFLLQLLEKYNINFIALAGFLQLIPAYLCAAFPYRILNIHPALLPKFGGKGMYGHHVHEAVKAAGESESGITIHFVTEKYDEGGIFFQAKTPLLATDSPEDIAAKVLKLEHKYYPLVIEDCIKLMSAEEE